MKLQFRLGVDEEDDRELADGKLPPAPARFEQGWTRAVFGLGLLAVSELLSPLAAGWMLLFAFIGVAAGIAWLLEERALGALGGIVFWSVLQFVSPPHASLSFTGVSFAVTFGAVALVQGVGVMIKRSWEAKHPA